MLKLSKKLPFLEGGGFGGTEGCVIMGETEDDFFSNEHPTFLLWEQFH